MLRPYVRTWQDSVLRWAECASTCPKSNPQKDCRNEPCNTHRAQCPACKFIFGFHRLTTKPVLPVLICHPELLLRRILHFHLSLVSLTKPAKIAGRGEAFYTDTLEVEIRFFRNASPLRPNLNRIGYLGMIISSFFIFCWLWRLHGKRSLRVRSHQKILLILLISLVKIVNPSGWTNNKWGINWEHIGRWINMLKRHIA